MEVLKLQTSDLTLRMELDDRRLIARSLTAFGSTLYEHAPLLGNLLMVVLRDHPEAGRYPLAGFLAGRVRNGERFSCDLVHERLPLQLTISIAPSGNTLVFSAQACWLGDKDVTLDVYFPFLVKPGMREERLIMPRVSGCVYDPASKYNVASSYMGNMASPFHMIQGEASGVVVLDKNRMDYQVDPWPVVRRGHISGHDFSIYEGEPYLFSQVESQPEGPHFHGLCCTRLLKAPNAQQRALAEKCEELRGEDAREVMWTGDFMDIGPIDVHAYRGNWKVGADYVRRARAHIPMRKSEAEWFRSTTFVSEEMGDSLVRQGMSFYDYGAVLADKQRLGGDLFHIPGFHQPARLNTDGVFNWINRGDYQIAAENLGGFEAARQGIEAIHRQGGRILYYVEGLIMWKLSRIGLSKGKEWALMEKDGSYTEHYKNFWHMCPSCLDWCRYLADTCAEIVRELNIDGFFIDSSCATFYHECHNPAHNHPHPYTWNWGLRNMLRMVREAVDRVRPGVILFVEGCGDMAREYADGFVSHTAAWTQGRFSLPVMRFLHPEINTFESWGVKEEMGSLDALKRLHVFNFVNGLLIYAHNPDRDDMAELSLRSRRYHDSYPELSKAPISLWDAQATNGALTQLFDDGVKRVVTVGNPSGAALEAQLRFPFQVGALLDRVGGAVIQAVGNACILNLEPYSMIAFEIIS